MATIVINSKKHGRHEVLVDDEDFEYLNQFKWSLNKSDDDFYAFRYSKKHEGIGKKCIEMHREIMKTPKGMYCDHKFHNTLDNRKEFLRNCTPSQNNKNRTAYGSSKYLGVHIKNIRFTNNNGETKLSQYWEGAIRVNGKIKHLGIFPNSPEGEILAAKAYNEAAIKHHGEFANLNKLTGGKLRDLDENGVDGLNIYND